MTYLCTNLNANLVQNLINDCVTLLLVSTLVQNVIECVIHWKGKNHTTLRNISSEAGTLRDQTHKPANSYMHGRSTFLSKYPLQSNADLALYDALPLLKHPLVGN